MSDDADAARRLDRTWFGLGALVGLCAAAALSARAPTTQHRRLQEDDFAECFEGTGCAANTSFCLHHKLPHAVRFHGPASAAEVLGFFAGV